ncbi:MAG: ketol-acid reductoisomerase [Rhodospirillaceae bacterium]|nr:ketol-acid reductoisomerase [Rhodospirillaceae bacterium]|tara:strand:- start:2490 stop:3506 length:1017 start_codon:yes stop_codon:yes gene_type:complete
MSKFYFDDDADLSLLDGKTVAILGYGNQGRSQALNMKDMGVNVVVGNIEDEYADSAREDGWDLMTIEDAAAAADVLMMLTSDDSQPEVYENWVKKSLKPGDVMNFAHAFNIHYEEIVAEPTTDVVMVAPRMLGEGVRATFLEGRGFPSLIAVAQDVSGKAMDMCLAISKAIGTTKMGALESNFEEEVLIDLFEEHQPGLYALRAMYTALVEAGCSPEAVMLDLYASGEGVKFAEYGRDLGAFERMKRTSNTAQFGHLVWSKQYFDEEKTLEGMRAMLANIKDGSFIEALKAERSKNSKAIDEIWKDNNAHELIEKEHELYQLLGRRPKGAPAPGKADD